MYFIQRINSFILNPQILVEMLGLSIESASKLTSTASGLTQSLLFSICPMIFKFMAYSEGSSSSMDMAEQNAMIYFWYFYIIARFMGQIVWDAVLSFFEGSK